MFLGKRFSEYAVSRVCVCVCFTGGDGANSCLRSYRGTKAGLFFPVDRVEIQAGTAEGRRGRAKGRVAAAPRCPRASPGRGDVSSISAAGGAEVALLGARTWVWALCALGEMGAGGS